MEKLGLKIENCLNRLFLSVYFRDGSTWEEVEWQLEKAGSLLASFVSAIHLDDSLIMDWDTYPTAYFEPDLLIVRGIIKGELEEEVKRSVFPSFRLGSGWPILIWIVSD